MNKVELIGNLGKDPEVKFTQAGKAWAKFTLATTSEYNGQTKTQWHNVTCFGPVAEGVGEMRKGDRAHVEGKIEYDTKEVDGVKKYYTNIIAFSVVKEERQARPDGGYQKKPHYSAVASKQADVAF